MAKAVSSSRPTSSTTWPPVRGGHQVTGHLAGAVEGRVRAVVPGAQVAVEPGLAAQAAHRLSLVHRPGLLQALGVAGLEGLEAQTRRRRTGVAHVGRPQVDGDRLTALLVPEPAVALALPAEPGEVESLGLHALHAVAHENPPCSPCRGRRGGWRRRRCRRPSAGGPPPASRWGKGRRWRGSARPRAGRGCRTSARRRAGRSTAGGWRSRGGGALRRRRRGRRWPRRSRRRRAGRRRSSYRSGWGMKNSNRAGSP